MSDYYNAGGVPAQGSGLTSANVRAEFNNVATGFGKLPALTGNAYKIVFINASGTAMDVVGGTGLLKLSASGVPTVAASGTDYAPATSGSAILKGNGSGGFSSAAAGSDYLAPPSGTALLKANSGGALANATAGTDYCAATSGSGILKGSSGNTATATAGTDYVAPGTATTFTATQTPYRATATAGAGTTYTWTLTAGQVLELTFGAGNITTLSVSGGVAGTFYTLYLKQDSTGSRTAGWSGFKWAGGTVPTLSTGANAIDIFTFYYDGTSMCCVGKAQGQA